MAGTVRPVLEHPGPDRAGQGVDHEDSRDPDDDRADGPPRGLEDDDDGDDAEDQVGRVDDPGEGETLVEAVGGRCRPPSRRPRSRRSSGPSPWGWASCPGGSGRRVEKEGQGNGEEEMAGAGGDRAEGHVEGHVERAEREDHAGQRDGEAQHPARPALLPREDLVARGRSSPSGPSTRRSNTLMRGASF